MTSMRGMTPASRLASALPAVLLAACASSPQPAPAVGAEVVPGGACSADASTPQILMTNPANLPASVYGRATGWEAQISFRIDEHGTPADIHARVGDGEVDADAIVAMSSDAFAGYRFCEPQAFSPATRWTASMRFRHVLVTRTDRASDMFVQLFVPAYTSDEVRANRTGTVRVAGTFAKDGRPSTLRLVASSGDAVLDQKSLAAMASWQLVFRPGTEPRRPLVFEQRYTYVIR